MKRAKSIALAVLAALAMGLPLCARAEESGGGHYLPGAVASFIDALPGRPGLAVANYFTFYDGSVGRSRQLPFGGLLASGLDATIFADTVAAVYETPLRLLGGEYGVAIAVPYVWVEVKGQHRDLVLAMSAKLEALIKAEMRVDDGRGMPEFSGVAWTIDTKDNETVLD